MAAPIDGNTYVIMNKSASTVLDLTEGNPAPGTSVHGWHWPSTYPAQGGRNQQWIIKASGQNDYHFIISPYCSNALDVTGDITQEGADLVANAQSGSDTQKWRFELVDQNFPQSYLIHNLGVDTENSTSTPRVVNLYGSSRDNGTKVQMSGKNNPPVDSELWFFIPVPSSN